MSDLIVSFFQKIVYDGGNIAVSSIMHNALAAVDQKENIRSAALQFGVACLTLHDWVTGKYNAIHNWEGASQD